MVFPPFNVQFAFETFCGHEIASEGLWEGIGLQTTIAQVTIKIYFSQILNIPAPWFGDSW
jgi:hypothetical protein